MSASPDGLWFYDQHKSAVFIDEIPVDGLADGNAIRIKYLDVCSMEVEIDVREDSTSHEMIFSQSMRQKSADYGVTLRITTGVGRKITLADATVSLPSTLATGGPQQGSQTYTFRSNRAKFY